MTLERKLWAMSRWLGALAERSLDDLDSASRAKDTAMEIEGLIEFCRTTKEGREYLNLEVGADGR